MEKTVVIDGRKVIFKSTGATVLRYKSQFKRDFFADILKLNVLNEKKGKAVSAEDLANIDFDAMYNMIWILAKTADPKIPEPMEWLDQFGEFPLSEIMEEIQDLLAASMGNTVKKK